MPCVRNPTQQSICLLKKHIDLVWNNYSKWLWGQSEQSTTTYVAEYVFNLCVSLSLFFKRIYFSLYFESFLTCAIELISTIKTYLIQTSAHRLTWFCIRIWMKSISNWLFILTAITSWTTTTKCHAL